MGLMFCFCFFFFNDTATTEIYTLSLHDALPIWYGQPITGGSNSVSVPYGGTNASPAGQIVINEIMYHPAADTAQFVELFNSSTNRMFDLSGWQLQGLSYTFPNGSVIAPNSCLVLAENGAAFAVAYGPTNPVFDSFSGTLPPSGTLRLL